jgi:transcriptional regulator with XRE-family HTH domain
MKAVGDGLMAIGGEKAGVGPEVSGDGATATKTDPAMVSSAIGAALRRARKAVGMSVAELASRTQLSQPHISQLENGRVAPSIAALYSLAGALGIGPDQLLPRIDAAPIQVTRRGEGALQPGSETDNPVMSRLLTGAPGRVIESHEFQALPGQDLGGWLEHPGEDFVYVMSGRMIVEFGSGRSEQLDAGDCIWYVARQRHRWRKVDDQPIHVLLVNGHERAERRP